MLRQANAYAKRFPSGSKACVGHLVRGYGGHTSGPSSASLVTDPVPYWDVDTKWLQFGVLISVDRWVGAAVEVVVLPVNYLRIKSGI